MEFDELIESILRSEKSKAIPILYIIEVAIIIDELGLLKGV